MKIDVESNGTIKIGKVGENDVTEVEFNITAWRNRPDLRQNGKYILFLKLPTQDITKKYELKVSGNTAKWIVSGEDLKNAGTGEAEVFFYADNEQIKTSPIYKVYIEQCL